LISITVLKVLLDRGRISLEQACGKGRIKVARVLAASLADLLSQEDVLSDYCVIVAPSDAISALVKAKRFEALCRRLIFRG
jgi:hypothetical protein